MKMLLVDSNQLLLGNIFAMTKKQSEVDLSLLRHTFINSVLTLNKKFRADEIVICTEGRSWRKESHPHYKANRTKGKEDSPYDYKIIYQHIRELLDEIDESLPWKVLRHPRGEADDIIGTLTRRHAGAGGEVVIISSDHDFKQLHKYGNVTQWSPQSKKFVKGSDAYLKEHIIRGDSGDYIPNLLSDYDHLLTEGKRQKSITAKFFKAVMNMSEEDILAHPDYSANYKRNRELIDLSYIPQDIKEEIVSMYDNYEGNTGRSKIFGYFMKKKLKMLMGEIKSV